jgi:hypothetical protein
MYVVIDVSMKAMPLPAAATAASRKRNSMVESVVWKIEVIYPRLQRSISYATTSEKFSKRNVRSEGQKWALRRKYIYLRLRDRDPLSPEADAA